MVVVPAIPDMDLAVAPGTARLDEFPGHLGKRPGDQQILPVGLIETDRVGNGNLTRGSAGAGPLVDGGGQGVLAMDGVDFHSRGTIANLHDTAAAFSFPGHRARCLCQLCWNSCWETCRGRPLIHHKSLIMSHL